MSHFSKIIFSLAFAFLLIVSSDVSHAALSTKLKKEIGKSAVKGKPGVNYKKAEKAKVKKVKVKAKPSLAEIEKQKAEKEVKEEASEKALITKPLTPKQKQKELSTGLEEIDVSPAAKTLLSITPKTTKPEQTPDIVIANGDPRIVTRIITVKKNDTFIALLRKLGYDTGDIKSFINLLERQANFSVRGIQPGQKFIFKDRVHNNKREFISLQIPTSLQVIKISKSGDDYKIFKDDKEIKSDYVYKSGTIQSSLTNLGSRAKIPSKVIAISNNILSSRYDLSSQLRKGDKYEVLYKVIRDKNNKIINSGKVIYVGLKGGVIKAKAYRFSEDGSDKKAEFYDSKGVAFKKALTRNPLKKKFRVSSNFGYRSHPVLKKRTMHSGIDYAAPTGTKLYAAGDGTITKIGRFGGYGNYIKIKHDSKWQTSYGHLHGFAKGMKKWKRVKKGQLIGYVGTTGRSTGPHLHYEIIKNGKHVDPAKVKLPVGKTLSKKYKTKFKREINAIEKELRGQR